MRRFLPAGAGGDAEPQTRPSLVEHLLLRRFATNVRELDAVLWQAMAASPGNAIEKRNREGRFHLARPPDPA